MRFLALDLGLKRTGIAVGDDAFDLVYAKETIEHDDVVSLVASLRPMIAAERAQALFVGLPRLPGGDEGEQARMTREIANVLETETGLPIAFIDERYTSSGGHLCTDRDAVAACTIASVALSQRKEKN